MKQEMISSPRPPSPSGDDWPPNPMRDRRAVQASRSHLTNSQLVILITLLALLSFLPACSRSNTPDPIINSAPAPSGDLSPAALAGSPDGKSLYVACSTAKQVLVFKTAQRQITKRLALPAEPSGLALSPDGTRLFVTCGGPASQVCVQNS
jgi:hypothetical protein